MNEEHAVDPMTILVVDDEQDNNDVLARSLRLRPNITTVASTSPKAALELLRQHQPQVLIVDFKMPDMNGIEFLALAAELSPGTTNIVLTAYPEQGEVMQGYERGLVHYIVPKPFQPHDILNVVGIATRLNMLSSSVRRLKERLSKL